MKNITINKNILKCFCSFATACCRVILVTHFLIKIMRVAQIKRRVNNKICILPTKYILYVQNDVREWPGKFLPYAEKFILSKTY